MLSVNVLPNRRGRKKSNALLGDDAILAIYSVRSKYGILGARWLAKFGGWGRGIRKSRYMGRKGFGLGVRLEDDQRARGPGNTSVGTFLADERCIAAVLSFLVNTKCGQIKEGVIVKGGGP